MKHIIRFIKYLVFRREWRAKNLHNETSAGNTFNMEHISVGRGTYGKLNIFQWGAENEALKIGSWCSIADGVKFLCGGNHSLSTISTYPFIKKYTGVNEAWSKGPIVINDDVWLGTNVLILSGIEIGQGAVIAAGAVVTNDIPPYAIAAGVPAKVIKYRFNQEMIDKLLQLDLGKMDEKYVQEHLSILTEPIDTQTLKKLSDLNK